MKYGILPIIYACYSVCSFPRRLFRRILNLAEHLLSSLITFVHLCLYMKYPGNREMDFMKFDTGEFYQELSTISILI